METIVKVRDVHFEYMNFEEQEIAALDGVDLDVEKGEFIVIIGHNGSGKSTLAKHINALLRPSRGGMGKGMDANDDENLWDIRQTAGMVFQNPDNQLVATIVEEDVAFGPENLGILPRRSAREWMGRYQLLECQNLQMQPHFLSGDRNRGWQ